MTLELHRLQQQQRDVLKQEGANTMNKGCYQDSACEVLRSINLWVEMWVLPPCIRQAIVVPDISTKMADSLPPPSADLQTPSGARTLPLCDSV